jgi:hypothetical protein
MPKPMFKWRIFLVKAVPALFLGTVEAPDEKTALEIAVDEFEVDDPEQRKKLIAKRRG